MLAVAVLGLLANIAAFACCAPGPGRASTSGRLPGGARRPARLGRRDRRGAAHHRHRLVVGRPAGRGRHRRVHPAAHLAAGPGRRPHPGAGRPGAPPGDRRARPAGRGPRCGRGARPARLDAHLRHGGGLRPPDHGTRARRSARCSPRRVPPCTTTSASSTRRCRSSPVPPPERVARSSGDGQLRRYFRLGDFGAHAPSVTSAAARPIGTGRLGPGLHQAAPSRRLRWRSPPNRPTGEPGNHVPGVHPRQR